MCRTTSMLASDESRPGGGESGVCVEATGGGRRAAPTASPRPDCEAPGVDAPADAGRRRLLRAVGTLALIAALTAPGGPGMTAPSPQVPLPDPLPGRRRAGRAAPQAPASAPRLLTIEQRTLDLRGRPASVLGFRGVEAGQGLVLGPGATFQVRLENRGDGPARLHWHGQTPPWAQDDAVNLAGAPLGIGERRTYRFAARSGTHWIHADDPGQMQRLLAAPLIVQEAQDSGRDRQGVILMLQDFTFRDPGEILDGLAAGTMSSGLLTHDAWLANGRTLADPQVIPVERRGRLRLRVINGATATGFLLDLGGLAATVVATDGNPVRPRAASRCPLAPGQRLDLAIDLPAGGGVWPVLAWREGGVERTGVILATAGAALSRIPEAGTDAAPALDPGFEEQLAAVTPLADRPPDAMARVALTGPESAEPSVESSREFSPGSSPESRATKAAEVWTLDGLPWGRHQPIGNIRPGQRVVLTWVNRTTVPQPMHIAGHHVQVLAVNQRRVSGALRDTLLVPARGTLTVGFDADNPGRWPVSCTQFYRRARGMMSELVYGEPENNRL